MNYSIRRYTLEDVDDLLVLMEMFLCLTDEDGNDNEYSSIDFDHEKVYTILRSNVNNTQFFCNVAVNENNVIVGVLAAQLVEYAFSRQRFAKDLIFFFTHECNSFNVIKHCVKSYQRWAKKRGVKKCLLSSSTGIKTRAFKLMCKRLGYKEIGTIFSLEVS